MLVRKFRKFFRKANLKKKESHNKGKSYEKVQFQGCFKCGKIDHLIKDCPLFKEEQRKKSKKQQQLVSKAFKKAIKATWGETSNEESEGENIENENLVLMARSDSDLDSDSTEESENEHEIGLTQSSTERVSAPALAEGTVMITNSLSKQELKYSGEQTLRQWVMETHVASQGIQFSNTTDVQTLLQENAKLRQELDQLKGQLVQIKESTVAHHSELLTLIQSLSPCVVSSFTSIPALIPSTNPSS
ncbi:hypothetical protein HAX54_037814 [Datura stramonium]|uniref:CCHC-type domain-containing protein n=1 Tax=Datura stramonium TaxID=4076 RepID=A0ABS8VKH1_DATST|nr:hypothetical protein [Datura stramonium]